MNFESEHIFGNHGIFASHIRDFEERPEQIAMAQHVHKLFQDGGHLAIEAGTGVGKSFAYLVPAIEKALEHNQRALISTFTITLQEQLIEKDIPLLAKAMGKKFDARLAKGRGNYLCIRRLESAINKGASLFSMPGDAQSQLQDIQDWSRHSEDGSLSDLPFTPLSEAWESASSEHGNCLGRECSFWQSCFYQRARRRLEKADLIVANHALLFSDLVLKYAGTKLLPDYAYIVIDEAHEVERVAENHFGIHISEWRIKRLLNQLYNPRTKRGLFMGLGAGDEVKLVENARKASKNFFAEVRNWYDNSGWETKGRCHKYFVDDILSDSLKMLRSFLSKIVQREEDPSQRCEYTRYVNRCGELVADLDLFLKQDLEDQVYWIERVGKSGRSLALQSAPLNVGPDVRRVLLDPFEFVVLTSATLSSMACHECKNAEDVTKGFSFFANRIGLQDYQAVQLDSPFNYEKQMRLLIEKDLPEPNAKDFVAKASESLKEHLSHSQGRAIVLFTSYDMLNRMADALQGWVVENGYELLLQGGTIGRGHLLKEFREGNADENDKRYILFGTESFWQGVDVPGEALQNVVITRLPFAVPDQALLTGRLERIREEGGNPFFDYQLPSAAIKFKQGFGRLVRHRDDSGIVVVLDSRIINKRYGKRFLRAIPKCKVEIISRDG